MTNHWSDPSSAGRRSTGGTRGQPRAAPRWTREQIRAARLTPLVPLLEKRGLQLVERETGNFSLPAFPGLIVKNSYWRWPERNQAGNAIDFFVQVLGLSFHDAMRHITGT